MKIIDLSVAIDNETVADPPQFRPHIEYVDHKAAQEEFCNLYGVTVNELPEGNGIASEFVRMTTHGGTHMDAPWHFYPTMNGGEPSMTIDEVPLDWCFGNGVVIDMRDKAPGYVVTAQDLEDYFAKVGYMPKEGDICLLMSGAGEYYGTDKYLGHQCGVGREGTLWLIDHGVKVVGTDAWSWDPPMPSVAKRYKECGDPSILWEGHRVGREKAYLHMEKLANLDKLPLTGFQVICLPIKVKKASAGWVRAVAVLND